MPIITPVKSTFNSAASASIVSLKSMIQSLPFRPTLRQKVLCHVFGAIDNFVEEMGIPHNLFASCFMALERVLLHASWEADEEAEDCDSDNNYIDEEDMDYFRNDKETDDDDSSTGLSSSMTATAMKTWTIFATTPTGAIRVTAVCSKATILCNNMTYEKGLLVALNIILTTICSPPLLYSKQCKFMTMSAEL